MDPGWTYNDLDRRTAEELQGFAPSKVFDAHAHLYRVADFDQESAFPYLASGPAEVTVQTFANLTVAVAPGGKVEFDLWGFGSETPGKQEYIYKLFTNFGFVVPGSDASLTFISLP